MDAGYTVTVWNRTPQAGDALVKAGAIWANSPKDVAAQNKMVFTMVSDAPATEAVMFGPDGLLEGADRKRAGYGKSVSVTVDLGSHRINKKKKKRDKKTT